MIIPRYQKLQVLRHGVNAYFMRRATFAKLAGLCNKVAECPSANWETGSKARTPIRNFSPSANGLCGTNAWKQVESEEEALRTRAVDFLYGEQLVGASVSPIRDPNQ
jgi:hypothetical protein